MDDPRLTVGDLLDKLSAVDPHTPVHIIAGMTVLPLREVDLVEAITSRECVLFLSSGSQTAPGGPEDRWGRPLATEAPGSR